MNRTTIKHLQSLIDSVNLALGTPKECYHYDNDGKYISNIGNYHLSGQYGGWSVEQTVNISGGVRTIFYADTKPVIGKQLRAYLAGIKARKEAQE